MSDQSDAPQPEGTVSDSEEWVSGEQGGPGFTGGGMMPDGDEMENWKKPQKGTLEPEGSLEEQGARFAERLDEK